MPRHEVHPRLPAAARPARSGHRRDPATAARAHPRAGPRRGGGRVTAGPLELQVVSVHPEDPLAAPLFAELAVEYDTRYGDLFGGASEELTRYPVEEFLPPAGELVLLLAGGSPLARGAHRRHTHPRTAQGKRVFLLAGGPPVAGGASRRHTAPGTAEVKRMWTAAAHRRRGLARRVLTELEDRAAARGYNRMYLTTGPRQPEAKALYLAAGWTPLFDPAVPRPTDSDALRRLPVAERLYAFAKPLGDLA